MRHLSEMKLKLNSFTAAAFFSLLNVGHSQPAPAPTSITASSMDLEERIASVVNLESQIATRENRMAEVRQDIVTLDGRIEKQIDSLVKMLANTRDSQSSKTKIAKLKQDAIQGLRRGIDLYVSKRREMTERIKGGDEAALKELSAFDARISTRVAQIVELSKSFPANADVKKYETEGSGDSHYWRGYYISDDNTRISEEWKQNRRDSSQTKVQRDQVTTAIREGIQRLTQRLADIEDQLANRKPTEDARKLYIQEIGSIDAQIETLNAQLVELAMPGGSTATEKPSLDEAINLEQLLKDARQDLRSDISNLFRLYDAYDKERSRVTGMKENLAARKAWLEKNAPATK
jgi:predicted  nucleic acid-binding Zn-ribbon protein